MVWNNNLLFFLIHSGDNSTALETNMDNSTKISSFTLAIKTPI